MSDTTDLQERHQCMCDTNACATPMHVRHQTSASATPKICIYPLDITYRYQHNPCATPNICIYPFHSFCMYETRHHFEGRRHDIILYVWDMTYIYIRHIYIRYNSCATYNICIHPFYSSCVWKTCLIYIRHNSSVTWKMSIHPIDLSSVYGIWLVCVCIYTYQTWFMCDLYVCIYIYHTWFMCDMKDLHSPLAVILSHMICMYHTWFVCITHDLSVSEMICTHETHVI